MAAPRNRRRGGLHAGDTADSLARLYRPMKFLLRCLPLLCLALLPLRAADSALIAAVRAADDERLAATTAGDRARLEAIFSDDLHYAHSNTKVDTKATFVAALVSKKSVYESFEHKDRTFVPAGPGIVLQHGRVLAAVRNASGVNKLDLGYLAVWRQENGRWRFLAWQSCRVPAPAPDAKK